MFLIAVTRNYIKLDQLKSDRIKIESTIIRAFDCCNATKKGLTTEKCMINFQHTNFDQMEIKPNIFCIVGYGCFICNQKTTFWLDEKEKI